MLRHVAGWHMKISYIWTGQWVGCSGGREACRGSFLQRSLKGKGFLTTSSNTWGFNGKELRGKSVQFHQRWQEESWRSFENNTMNVLLTMAAISLISFWKPVKTEKKKKTLHFKGDYVFGTCHNKKTHECAFPQVMPWHRTISVNVQYLASCLCDRRVTKSEK